MRVISIIKGVALWAIGLSLIPFAFLLRAPTLRPLGQARLAYLLLACAALAALLLRERGALRLALLPVMLASALGCLEESAFRACRERVLQTDPARLARLGRHVVIGFDRFEEAEELVSRGAVGGVFITARNAAGLTRQQLRDSIARLQRLQQIGGRPPLLVMADQEGGLVSRLTPPLPAQPSLAEALAGATGAELDARIEAFARAQAEALASVGVTVNLAPVVDVPRVAGGFFDPHSRIQRRAIAGDPARVAHVAARYGRALAEAGVRPTFKHFPGLGRVAEDTHYFRADLEASLDELRASDWLPYRAEPQLFGGLVMVGHVGLPAVDRELASRSPKIVDGLLRGELGFEGLAITDDLCMRPIAHGPGGVGGGAIDALNAGVDLLLISWDGEQFFPAMQALLQAEADGRLETEVLARSVARLDGIRALAAAR